MMFEFQITSCYNGDSLSQVYFPVSVTTLAVIAEQ